jgi:uncharacterized protein
MTKNANYLYYLGCIHSLGKDVKLDKKLSFEYFKQSAKLGHIESQFNVALMLFNGEGTEKDLVKSFKNFEIPAKKNHQKALYWIGYMYKNGLGVKVDYKKAFENLEKSYKNFENKLKNGIFEYGTCFKDGLGVEKDLEKSLKLFLEASELKHSNSSLMVGELYEGKKEFKEAKKYFEKSIQEGNLIAKCKLGFYYMYGDKYDNEKNEMKALELWESVYNNSTEAKYQIGIYYYNKKDKKCLNHFISASLEKHIPSIYLLGIFFNKTRKYL